MIHEDFVIQYRKLMEVDDNYDPETLKRYMCKTEM